MSLNIKSKHYVLSQSYALDVANTQKPMLVPKQTLGLAHYSVEDSLKQLGTSIE